MLKTALKQTSLYRQYFAYKHARLITEWSPEDHQRMEFYKSVIQPGRLVFDVGAHLGNRTKVFLHLGCRVIAVEPQRNYASVLRKAFGRRVTVVCSALSDQIGKKPLKGSGPTATLSSDFIELTIGSGRFTAGNWQGHEIVPTTTLDSLVACFGVPDFIKIDVEGHEDSVLRGLTIPVRSLSLEFHPEILVGTVCCLDALDALGQYRYNFSYGESLVLHFSSWVLSEEMRAFLANESSRRGDVYAQRF